VFLEVLELLVEAIRRGAEYIAVETRRSGITYSVMIDNQNSRLGRHHLKRAQNA
jgi:phosphosulfolactate synthase (CoM biosynthesis protein A)